MVITRGYTSIYFAENQLSPSLIGLSPLATAHPGSFQPTAVRASTRSTRASPWPWLAHPVSGLPPATERPVQTRFRYGYTYRLNLAAEEYLADPLTKRYAVTHCDTRRCRHMASTECRQTVSGSISLLSPGFFSPFPRGTGSLSVAR